MQICMEIWYGNWVCKFDMEIWYGHLVWKSRKQIGYGNVVWKFDMEIRHVHFAWTFRCGNLASDWGNLGLPKAIRACRRVPILAGGTRSHGRRSHCRVRLELLLLLRVVAVVV